MPVETDLDDHGVFTLTATGDVTFEEVCAATRDIFADPRYVERHRVIWDLREGRFDWGSVQVQGFVLFVRDLRPPGQGRVAAVVSRGLTSSIARMYEALSRDIPSEVMVFHDFKKAQAWVREEF